MASQYPLGDHDDPTLLVLEEAFCDFGRSWRHTGHIGMDSHDHERKMELSGEAVQYRCERRDGCRRTA